MTARQTRATHQRRRSNETDSLSFRGLATSLRMIGVPHFGHRLVLIALAAFASGLAQATLLVLLTQVAVNAALHKHVVAIHGLHFSILQVVLLSFGLLGVYFVGSLLAGILNAALSTSALEGVRRSLIHAFFDAEWSVQSQERLGHIQQLITFNATNIASIMTTLAGGLQAVLIALALLLAAFVVSPLTAVLVLILGIFLSLVLRPLNTRSKRSSRELSQASDSMGTLVTEYTRMTREFRLFGVEAQALSLLDQDNQRSARAFRTNRTLGQLSPVFYQTLALAFVIVAIAVITDHQGGGLAGIAAVFLLMLRSLTYGSAIQSTLQQLRSFEGFIEAVRSDYERFIASRLDVSHQLLPSSYVVAADHLSFSYNSHREVLSNLTFSIPEGAFVAIVGRSGSGKTTLSQLLLGMREPGHGTISIGDIAPTRIRKCGGRSPLAFVPQEPVLLHGSIRYNVAFFRDVSDADVELAARSAHIHDDILAMPDGYDTGVGEGGNAISGGQRQRLAIARALIGNPRVLLLDEPTSALDQRSEALLRQTLSELRGTITVIIISHRLATVRDSDLVLVLENGQLADFGAPDSVYPREAFQRVAHLESTPPRIHSYDSFPHRL